MNTLKHILYKFLCENSGWHGKGELYMLAQQEGYSPEGVARRARELVNENKIFVDYYKSKRNVKLARYSAKEKEKPKVTFVEKDGIMVAVLN